MQPDLASPRDSRDHSNESTSQKLTHPSNTLDPQIGTRTGGESPRRRVSANANAAAPLVTAGNGSSYSNSKRNSRVAANASGGHSGGAVGIGGTSGAEDLSAGGTLAAAAAALAAAAASAGDEAIIAVDNSESAANAEDASRTEPAASSSQLEVTVSPDAVETSGGAHSKSGGASSTSPTRRSSEEYHAQKVRQI